MPKYTENLDLYEFDPETDNAKDTTFNVKTFLNDNFDKIDECAGKLANQNGRDISTESGVHGLRYHEDKLQAKNAQGEWHDTIHSIPSTEIDQITAGGAATTEGTYLDSTGVQQLWGKTIAALPTKISELENDDEYATKSEVNSAIETAFGIAFGGDY